MFGFKQTPQETPLEEQPCVTISDNGNGTYYIGYSNGWRHRGSEVVARFPGDIADETEFIHFAEAMGVPLSNRQCTSRRNRRG